MKNRKRLTGLALVTASAVFAGTTANAQDAWNKEDDEGRVTTRHTGEMSRGLGNQAQESSNTSKTDHAFDEIFFGNGPNAKTLAKNLKDPIYASLAKEKEASREDDELHLKVRTQVESMEPGFVEGFNNEIATGNPYRIERALERGSDLITQSLGNDLNNSDANASPQCAYVFAWAVAVLVNYGAAVNIETYALVHHKVKLAESRAVISEEQASLERQRVVTAISETYAP